MEFVLPNQVNYPVRVQSKPGLTKTDPGFAQPVYQHPAIIRLDYASFMRSDERLTDAFSIANDARIDEKQLYENNRAWNNNIL